MSGTGLEGRGVIVTVSAAVETFGGVDVLVDNAGVLDRLSAVAGTDDDEWERVVRTDLTAASLLSRAAPPHTTAAAVVLLASGAASGTNGAVLPVDHGWRAV
ncbi:SDR family oxidoreductase [Streptomyces sp. NPDC096311]|uniref:SDR family oxidoreductase n=1 Tax=Streptomyces sp. NPDC096311 TaxID=3366083 RepID=UPI00380FC55A